MHVSESQRPRRSQAERRAETRAALLEAAARGLSRNGYGDLNLAEVAAEAGYTRGVLYHLYLSALEGLAIGVAGRTPHDGGACRAHGRGAAQPAFD